MNLFRTELSYTQTALIKPEHHWKAGGFMDGTNIFISRPRNTAQRAIYSGHKRRNALKFKAISLPDGLALHLSGPNEGHRHEISLLRRSKVSEDLQRCLLF